METSYHGFFVGPVSETARLQSAVSAVGAPDARLVEDGPRGAWCIMQIQRFAESLAQELGEGTWVWEAELRNDFEDEVDGNESHSGILRGWQPGTEVPAVEADLWEEGYIRGGVMEDCALEYVGQCLEEELEENPGAVPGSVEERGSATDLVAALLAAGLLEIVNDQARRTLPPAIERCLESRDPHEAAACVLSVLEDTPEVAEIYADEAEVEALIAQTGRRG